MTSSVFPHPEHSVPCSLFSSHTGLPLVPWRSLSWKFCGCGGLFLECSFLWPLVLHIADSFTHFMDHVKYHLVREAFLITWILSHSQHTVCFLSVHFSPFSITLGMLWLFIYLIFIFLTRLYTPLSQEPWLFLSSLYTH